MLEVRNLYKSYKTGSKIYPVLHDVNISINDGEFVSIMGASGSGKTTLLNCISGFISYEKGEIILNGKRLKDLSEEEISVVRNENLGFVFQDFMLLDGLTVFENICMPRIIQNGDWRKMEKEANKLLEIFNISEISDKFPVEISGGQKQRTAVARALINEPNIILADEPTGNLDSKSSESVIKSFIEVKKRLGVTVFMVTHDSIAASYCDRVIVMKDGRVFKEIINNGNRKEFLDKLLNILKDLGGDNNDNE
ncbi:ABC transporter ATP-binding protein [Peptacetobacter hominis]|uniref:ABC transporter ATP-binding protein n=1 Tax=Peptacetobacter hominis TaxID=2743610 RepID=A0A544QT77_9FIRM|nr:ABC transporter ATP-binding protein [Peptacetobacter hominis]TQQ83897.1 ABC transporter ATP-binding protein [Peptacetobacter hominis]